MLRFQRQQQWWWDFPQHLQRFLQGALFHPLCCAPVSSNRVKQLKYCIVSIDLPFIDRNWSGGRLACTSSETWKTCLLLDGSRKRLRKKKGNFFGTLFWPQASASKGLQSDWLATLLPIYHSVCLFTTEKKISDKVSCTHPFVQMYSNVFVGNNRVNYILQGNKSVVCCFQRQSDCGSFFFWDKIYQARDLAYKTLFTQARLRSATTHALNASQPSKMERWDILLFL